MKSRHRSREIALQILYQNDLTNILPAPGPVLGTVIKRPPIKPVAPLQTSDNADQPDNTSTETTSDPVAEETGLSPLQKAQALRDTASLLQRHFAHFNVPEELREFIAELVTGTLTQKDEIDALLEKHAAHWKVARMSSVDRSILRMAAYEMLYLRKTPSSVVIDEAIELAKEFGTAETASFINGILDSLKK